MTRRPLAVFLAFAGLSVTAPAQQARLSSETRMRTLVLPAEPEVVCSAPVGLVSWTDPSDARTFAVHPTARLDDQELAAAHFRGLVEVTVDGGKPRLLVLGVPLRSPSLWFSRVGWHARWPFC